MSDRNWEAELAKIDKQLASVSDEQLRASAAAPVATQGGRAAAPKALGGGAPQAAAPSAGVTLKPWTSWAKVIIAVGAAAGMMWWPWIARCGPPVWGFTIAAGGVSALGVWSAIGTWRHRLGWAHIASLLVVGWGVLLGAREVLPRVGYAIPTLERPAAWSCDALPPAPSTSPNTTPTPTSTPPGLPPTTPGL